MSEYLDSDSIRRQANTVIRLTVVTTLGLIGTIATGVLGMNIFGLTEESWQAKLYDFVLVLIPTTILILVTVFKSKALSDFLEALSEARMRRRRKENVLDGPEPEL